jgi:hypothetical protein
LWHSAAVIGMRSMALLEAALLGVPAVSYQPGLLGPNLCTAARLGAVPLLSDEASLASWCSNHLHARRTVLHAQCAQYTFAPADSAERVLALALDGRPQAAL